MRILTATLLVLLLSLQFKLWAGDGNVAEVWSLRQAMSKQERENTLLRERNLALEAEVADLKTGLDAVEERARKEMGMIKQGETFYQIVESGSGG
ncbi:MAG: cell division protein FtsB [Gammaproteobacteria bacterium]